MRDDLLRLTRTRLDAFFDAARHLTREQARDLRRAPGLHTRSRHALTLDDEFLGAVASGAWSGVHPHLAREARHAGEVCARRLTPLVHRRALARAIEYAALVVIADTDPATPLPRRLRARLAAPWTRATGRDPAVTVAAATPTAAFSRRRGA